jgi:hypothetical protein
MTVPGQGDKTLFFDVKIGLQERLRVWGKVGFTLVAAAVLYGLFWYFFGQLEMSVGHRFYLCFEGAAISITVTYFLLFYDLVLIGLTD